MGSPAWVLLAVITVATLVEVFRAVRYGLPLSRFEDRWVLPVLISVATGLVVWVAVAHHPSFM